MYVPRWFSRIQRIFEGLPRVFLLGAVRNVNVDLQLLDGGDRDFAVKAAVGGNLCLLLSKTRAVLDR
jgi:hypothetical protein